ncbi:hypothetical protein G7054_g3825 [Neopestalotiopsis clavispora]|nr:hypothetical protein G7054_g3825 [Neopestalotiopsis clavispora]
MAEALGLASSIITVIELSAKAVKQCKHIIDTARDAPRDLRNILVEVSSLKAALENLDYLNKVDHDFAEEVSNQKGIGNAVHECEETLGDLVKQLGDLSIRDSRQTRPGKRAKIKAAFQWTWNETTARKLLNDVLQHKTTITLGLLTQTSCSREVHEVKLAVLGVQKSVDNTTRREICAWLQTTNPTNIHNTALKNHEIETGEWVLRLPQWNFWLQGETSHRFLWVYGIPGAGKTVLSSHLSEQCQSYCNESVGKPSVCVYYYCSYRNHQDETLPLIRWLVSQLIRKTRHVPNHLVADHENDHQPSIKTMKEALSELLVHVQTVYLFVDAVDESQPRAELLLFLEEIVTNPNFGRIQLLATSRKYHDITSVLTRLSHPISMSNEEVDKDIRRFIAARLEIKFLGWRAKYKANILGVLVSKAQGILPQTIEETYELILLEIDEQDRSFARTIFLMSEEEVDTAKCAHYTVVEYFFSEQIKGSKVAFFALSNNDVVAEFVATTIAVAKTINLKDLRSEYWESFQSYCSRAAWLSIFTWESDLAEHEALWMGLIHIWSNDLSYFSSADELFRHVGAVEIPESNQSWLLTLEPDDEVQHIQEFPPGILACLVLNSSHILASKLVSHYGSQILEVPFHFNPNGAYGGSKIPRKDKQFGTAVEAASMTTCGFGGLSEVLDGFELLSNWFDNAQLALIYVGLHIRSDGDCGCDTLDGCPAITKLLQCVEADSGIQHCLTPLQLSVYCLDLRAVEALLESDVDPNGIGACDGRPTPIYLFKVDDRWWSASPLHMIRHAPFAAEDIDGTLDIMQSREAQRSQIEKVLIQFGAKDFGYPSDTSTCTERSTGCEESSMGTQALSVRDEPDGLDSFDETE